MSFQLDTGGLPRLTCYNDALLRWTNTLPWRGYADTNTRPLDKSRRKTHVTIRKLNDDSIACRLHATDVVVWHPDNSLTLTPYASVSTDSFAAVCTGGWYSGLGLRFNSAPYNCVSLKQDGGWYLYKLNGPTRMKRDDKGGWHILTPDTLGTIDEYVLDTAKARAALKATRYEEYRLWRSARRTLKGRPSGCPAGRRPDGADGPLGDIALLQSGVDGWPWLDWITTPDQLRKKIYEDAGCISVVKHKRVEVSDLQRVLRSRTWI